MNGQMINRKVREVLRLGFKTPDGALKDILNRSNLKLVDLGARGGALAQLKLLAPFSHYYACEPDKEEAKLLPDKLRQGASWRNITVIPDAISSNEGTAILNITKQPGLSSLLKPDYSIVNRFHTAGYFNVASTILVKTASLDHSATQYGFSDACFLKLDTQGSELDILRSGSKLLTESILGVYIEVFFHQFYVGQPLFSEIDSYLRKLNFSLFDLELKVKRRASFNTKLLSRGQPVWGNALYMKEPEMVICENVDENALLKVSQLLAISLAYGHYDFTLELTKNGKPALLLNKTYGDKVHESVMKFIRYRRV